MAVPMVLTLATVDGVFEEIEAALGAPVSTSERRDAGRCGFGAAPNS